MAALPHLGMYPPLSLERRERQGWDSRIPRVEYQSRRERLGGVPSYWQPGMLIRAWGRAGERENRYGKQQRVREVVDPLDLDPGIRVGQRSDQDRPIDEQDQQHNPGPEISCRHPRLLVQQNAYPGDHKKCASEIADEPMPRNPRRH